MLKERQVIEHTNGARPADVREVSGKRHGHAVGEHGAKADKHLFGTKRRHSCAGGTRVAMRVAEHERIRTRQARASMQRAEAVTSVIVKNA